MAKAAAASTTAVKTTFTRDPWSAGLWCGLAYLIYEGSAAEPRRFLELDMLTFFYSNMLSPKRPHTPDEFTLELKVEVEGLRMEIILFHSAPLQCHPLPRRVTVGTGSKELGTPRRSPAIGTGSDEPGVSRVETSATEEEVIPLETNMDGFL